MEVCKVPKQQPNFVKFCIIIHALMCNSHTKFGPCSFYSRVIKLELYQKINCQTRNACNSRLTGITNAVMLLHAD